MKTPDVIKKGLKACVAGECHSEQHECPYSTERVCTYELVKDILTYVIQLENQLRDAEKMATPDPAPTWISVEEKLPEREKYVLAVDGHGFINMLAFWKKKSNEWTWIDTFGHFNHVNDITHWMPLPAPPKEERKFTVQDAEDAI